MWGLAQSPFGLTHIPATPALCNSPEGAHRKEKKNLGRGLGTAADCDRRQLHGSCQEEGGRCRLTSQGIRWPKWVGTGQGNSSF